MEARLHIAAGLPAVFNRIALLSIVNPGARSKFVRDRLTAMRWVVDGAAVIGILVGGFIALLIGAVILRGAVSIANMCLGDQRAASYDDGDGWGDEDDDDDDAPRRRSRKRRPTKAIPEPGVGQAMLIIFVLLIVSGVVRYAMGEMMGAVAVNVRGFQDIAVLLLVIFMVQFFIMSTMLSVMLPTTFGRACLVSIFYILIWIAICVVVFGALYAVNRR